MTDDLILRFLDLDQFAKLGRLAGLAFAYDFRVRLEHTHDLSCDLLTPAKIRSWVCFTTCCTRPFIVASDEGAGAASGETDPAANLCRGEQVAGQNRECVRVARKSYAKARPASRPSLANWSRSRNRRIKSSVISKSLRRPSDRQLLVPSIEVHQRRFRRIPAWVAADAGFHSQQNEKTACSCDGSVPNQKTKSAERRRTYRQRWFRRGQRWRTGCEGRISALKTATWYASLLVSQIPP